MLYGEQLEMLFGFWAWVGRMKRWRCGVMSDYFDHLFILFSTPLWVCTASATVCLQRAMHICFSVKK